jgi:hypothetical protein
VHANFADESACLKAIIFEMKGRSCLYSQITGGVENSVPLHVDIPCTGGRQSDLPFEAVQQEYLKFPYEYFLSVLPSGVTVVNVVLQTTAEGNITRIKIRLSASQISVLIILSPKASDKACIDIRAVWAVAESS